MKLVVNSRSVTTEILFTEQIKKKEEWEDTTNVEILGPVDDHTKIFIERGLALKE